MKRIIILFLLVLIGIPLFSLSLSDFSGDDFVVSVIRILDNASQTGSFDFEENDSNKDVEDTNVVVSVDDNETTIAEEEKTTVETQEGNQLQNEIVEQQVNESANASNQAISNENLETTNQDSKKDDFSRGKQDLLDNTTDKMFSARINFSLSGKFRFYSYEIPRFINVDCALNFMPLKNYFFISSDFDFSYYNKILGKVESDFFRGIISLSGGLLLKNSTVFTPFLYGKASYTIYNNNKDNILFFSFGAGLDVNIFKSLDLTMAYSYLLKNDNPHRYRVGLSIDII